MHDALKMGLADHAVDEAGAEDVALRLARDIARVRRVGWVFHCCLPPDLLQGRRFGAAPGAAGCGSVAWRDDCPSAAAAAVCCVPPCAPYVTSCSTAAAGRAAHWQARPSQPASLPLHVPMRLLQGGPLALRLAKQAISLGAELDLGSGLKLEEACYAQVGGGAMLVCCVVSVHPLSGISARCVLHFAQSTGSKPPPC